MGEDFPPPDSGPGLASLLSAAAGGAFGDLVVRVDRDLVDVVDRLPDAVLRPLLERAGAVAFGAIFPAESAVISSARSLLRYTQ